MHTLTRTTTVAAALALSASWACTSASTNLTGPSDGKCQIAVSNSPASFAAGGGTGALTINAARECTWSVTAEAGWVTLNDAREGQGEAVVSYVVAPNPAPAARSTALAVVGNRVALTQAAAPCRFELSRTGESVAAAGGTARVDVTTLSGCAWSTASSVPWITVTSGQSGNASGAVAMAVAPNTGDARQAQVTVAGQPYLVQQAAASSAPPPSNPPSPSPTPTPTPTPPPTPDPPPSDEQVEIEGRVFFLTGRCPDVRFFADLTGVVANGETNYRRGNCRDLSLGDRVKVDGRRLSDGTVQATRIEFSNDNDDDD